MCCNKLDLFFAFISIGKIILCLSSTIDGYAYSEHKSLPSLFLMTVCFTKSWLKMLDLAPKRVLKLRSLGYDFGDLGLFEKNFSERYTEYKPQLRDSRYFWNKWYHSYKKNPKILINLEIRIILIISFDFKYFVCSGGLQLTKVSLTCVTLTQFFAILDVSGGICISWVNYYSRLWNKRSPLNNHSPPSQKCSQHDFNTFFINLGIAVIFQFFFLENFSKNNKSSLTFIPESRVHESRNAGFF